MNGIGTAYGKREFGEVSIAAFQVQSCMVALEEAETILYAFRLLCYTSSTADPVIDSLCRIGRGIARRDQVNSIVSGDVDIIPTSTEALNLCCFLCLLSGLVIWFFAMSASNIVSK